MRERERESERARENNEVGVKLAKLCERFLATQNDIRKLPDVEKILDEVRDLIVNELIRTNADRDIFKAFEIEFCRPILNKSPEVDSIMRIALEGIANKVTKTLLNKLNKQKT